MNAEKLELQELRETVAQLRLVEKKYRFLVTNSYQLCTHWVTGFKYNNSPRPDIVLAASFMHIVPPDTNAISIAVDEEAFEAALARLMGGEERRSCRHE